MELVQVAILIALAVALGLIFKLEFENYKIMNDYCSP